MILLSRDASPAQVADHFIQRMIIGLVVLALMYAGKAAIELVSGNIGDILTMAMPVGSLLIVLLIIPPLWRYMQLRRANKGRCPEADSYIAQMYKEAAVRAFGFTFIALMVMGYGAELDFYTWSTAFVLNAIIALSLGVLAFNFFRFTRDSDDEEDDFDADHQA